jgi:hypothetical protein
MKSLISSEADTLSGGLEALRKPEVEGCLRSGLLHATRILRLRWIKITLTLE